MSSSKIKFDIAKKETKTQILKEFNNGNRLGLSNKDKKKIFKGIEQNILLGKFYNSINSLILGLLYFREYTLENLKRRGIFRYSNFSRSKCIIRNLCSEILALSIELNLKEDEISYFESIRNLYPILDIFKKKRYSIIKEIKSFKRRPSSSRFKKSFIRTLIAFIESLFITNYFTEKKGDPNSLEFYSKESIAEAASYIIFLYTELFSINRNDFGIIDEDYILSGRIEKILLDARHIKDLQDFEIYIDHFGYRCTKKNNSIHIYPPFPEIEKSIRIGYIKTDLQIQYNYIEKGHISSLNDLANKFLKELDIDLFKYCDTKNYPRYIFMIPESHRKLLIEKVFKSDDLFEEEIEYFINICKENFLDYNKLKSVLIRNNLTLLDFLKFKRFFQFMNYFVCEKFSNTQEKEHTIVLRSLVPSIEKDYLYKLLDQFASKDKIDSFLDIVTWHADKKIIFDLQYQPFFSNGKLFLIPLCIFVYSNTIRNIYALEHKLGNPEILENGSYDMLADFLAVAFESQGFRTAKGIKYSFEKKGEIDFIAFKKDFLFIAECKKSLFPTSLYELRTLYDYCSKANKQLNLILKAFKNPKTRQEISNKIGYDLDNIKDIKTSIITNNRMFVGLKQWNHPVRNIQEMYNIVKYGTIKIYNGLFSMWGNNIFSSDDLVYYLEDTKFHKPYYDAMIEKKITYNLHKLNISFTTYFLHQKKFFEQLKKLNLRRVKKEG